MLKKDFRKNGFTLIELLLVILIIGILSGLMLSVVNVTGIRSKARDGQRAADLKRVQAALELYYADTRIYPIYSAGWGVVSTVLATLAPNYINQIPTDPSISGVTFCSANLNYYYKSDAAGLTYTLATIMEVSMSNAANLCSNTGCVSTPANCYSVKNP